MPGIEQLPPKAERTSPPSAPRTAASRRPEPQRSATGQRKSTAASQPRGASPRRVRLAAPQPPPSPQRVAIEKFIRTPKGYVLVALLVLLIVALPAQGMLAVQTTIASVLAAGLVECLFRRSRVPTTSAVLTGLFVAMVLDPHNSLAVVVLTASAAIAAKHLLRTSKSHIFNPAVGALTLSPLLLGAGESWWGAAAGLPTVALVPLLAAGYLVVDRVNKFPTVLTFLGVYFTLFTAAAVLLPGENMHLAQFYRDPFVGAVLFFACFMLTDPPTTPARTRDQLYFGAAVAVLAVTVELTRDTLTYMFIGLLLGNGWWSWRRLVTARKAPPRATGAASKPESLAAEIMPGLRPAPNHRTAPKPQSTSTHPSRSSSTR